MIIQVDKEKILKEFEKKYVSNKLDSELNEIIEKYKNNREIIEENLISKFDFVCKNAILLQEKELKGEIKYIYISLLRTSILENKADYRIDLYDKNWVLDEEECSININLNFVYDSLFNHMEELLEKKNKYGRSIKIMDIENIKIKEAKKYHLIAIDFLRGITTQFIKTPSYVEMKKTEDIAIFVGEYMDETKKIY